MFSRAIHLGVIGAITLPPVPLVGIVTVFRGDPFGQPDVILTEMVSMLLQGGGITLRAGDGIGNLASDGPLYTAGAITELPGQFTADSFFDVFFEIFGGPLGSLVIHNNTPCTMRSVIDRVPPAIGTQYFCDGGDLPLALFDQNDNQVGFLISATHEIITPEPNSMLLLATGVVAGLGFRRRLRRAS